MHLLENMSQVRGTEQMELWFSDGLLLFNIGAISSKSLDHRINYLGLCHPIEEDVRCWKQTTLETDK